MRTSLLRLLAGAIVMAATYLPANAQQPRKLEVNVFPAGFIIPLWVAQEKGLFAANGVEVNLINTPNSVQQMTGLIDGRFDIAMTAIDNVIAYMEGQGEAPTTTKPDIVAVMGSSSGFLSLIASPDIKAIGDFKGKVLSVDAMTTGYAFTLRKMLEKAGLGDTDFTLVRVGGMKERYEALVGGKQAGTLLVPPFTLAAIDAGHKEIATALSVFGHFQGGVAAVRREWAAANRDALIGYIRGNVAALDWLYDEKNRAEAAEIFAKRLPGTKPEVALKSLGVLLHPQSGFPKKAEIDVEGVKVVMEARSQYAEPKKALTDPSRYYDLGYYKAALAPK